MSAATQSYRAPTVPTMSVGEALAIAWASPREIHAMGYSNTSDARERAAERLAETVEDLQARVNHIIAFCADEIAGDEGRWPSFEAFAREVQQLAQGIAPEATDAALERAS